ncbi:hypothetical protein HPB52_020873 [Rhipicephalus sanguineus]|uniref:Uncharacterized protein n=1 Tax=Rhipicephalus sanguineus TaxID=34632 RepID=A0A9D4Q2Q2_RHISA|nr:hypothetical protein HPB52_020873 [Rhipicephalus sanguineus]
MKLAKIHAATRRAARPRGTEEDYQDRGRSSPVSAPNVLALCKNPTARTRVRTRTTLPAPVPRRPDAFLASLARGRPRPTPTSPEPPFRASATVCNWMLAQAGSAAREHSPATDSSSFSPIETRAPVAPVPAAEVGSRSRTTQ